VQFEPVVPGRLRVRRRAHEGEYQAVVVQPGCHAEIFGLDVVGLRPDVGADLHRDADGEGHLVDVVDRLVGQHPAAVPALGAVPGADALEVGHRAQDLDRYVPAEQAPEEALTHSVP